MIAQLMMRQRYSGYHLLVVVSLLIISLAASDYATRLPVSESAIVESLPGFSGDLPFKLETGYIGVGMGQEVQLFYYFVESELNPESNPLMLWLTGGPGCASLSTFFHEYLGPLSFNLTGLYFNWTTSTWETDLPALQFNPYSWTKFVSILFVDAPVGTGFSYATTAESYYSDDVTVAQHILEFQEKWFMGHPQFATNPFYVGACSYSAKIVPYVTQAIVKGNEDGLGSPINVKGYVLGSPSTDPEEDDQIGIYEFMHRVSITSDELYEQSKANCGDSYKNESNLDCEKNLGYAAYLSEPLFGKHILETTKKGSNPNHRCPDYDKMLLDNWMNNAQVREALHVRKGTVGEVTRCNRTVAYETYNNQTIPSSVGYHQYLSTKPLRALIYSGDQDLVVPYVSTLRWIKRLNAQISDDWRPWFLNNQVAGYVTEFSNGHYNLTFTTIKGAGHCASTYNPRESHAMFQKWLANIPL